MPAHRYDNVMQRPKLSLVMEGSRRHYWTHLSVDELAIALQRFKLAWRCRRQSNDVKWAEVLQAISQD